MVMRDQLRLGGLRAYELGRLRTALRIGWVIGPAAVLCAVESKATEMCMCLAGLLLGAAVFLRWRNRRGVTTVRRGLIAGGLPLLAGLVVARLAPSCANAPLLSTCTVACLGLGVPSGVWLGSRLARGTGPALTWLAPLVIALLVASLGCLALGVAGVVGVVLGLTLGVSSSGASFALSGRSKAD